jgi:hypothetical protein
MSESRVYTHCIVQNESDVIESCLDRAEEFSERIWIWDLGSSDGTWELLQSRPSDIVDVSRREDLSSLSVKEVRMRMLDELRHEIPEGCWLYWLDADEFIIGDPRPLLAAAAREGAELVRGWTLEFRPTPADIQLMDELGEAKWQQIPLVERLRSYQVGFPFWKFLRMTPEVRWWVEDGRSRVSHVSGRKPREASERFVMRHYQYRSPSQVALRLETRQKRRAAAETATGIPQRSFWYEQTEAFRDHVVPAHRCRRWEAGEEAPSVTTSDVLRYRARWLRYAIQKLPRNLRGRLVQGR